MTRQDVVVVGGGQAGLAIGYYLAEQGRRFTILEAADAPAAAWSARWDSLELFTPAKYDGLPGREFPGDPDHYPTRDEVVAYLTDYARDFELPVERGSRVRSVRRDDDAYRVVLGDRTYETEQVVIATGPFQVPRVPIERRDVFRRGPDVERRPLGMVPERLLVGDPDADHGFEGVGPSRERMTEHKDVGPERRHPHRGRATGSGGLRASLVRRR